MRTRESEWRARACARSGCAPCSRGPLLFQTGADLQLVRLNGHAWRGAGGWEGARGCRLWRRMRLPPAGLSPAWPRRDTVFPALTSRHDPFRPGVVDDGLGALGADVEAEGEGAAGHRKKSLWRDGKRKSREVEGFGGMSARQAKRPLVTQSVKSRGALFFPAHHASPPHPAAPRQTERRTWKNAARLRAPNLLSTSLIISILHPSIHPPSDHAIYLPSFAPAHAHSLNTATHSGTTYAHRAKKKNHDLSPLFLIPPVF